MRILPREHGATVIWLSALIIALATLPSPPQPHLLILFLTASLSTLLIIGLLTGSSTVILRIEKSRVMLPLTSLGLTLITPLASLIMLGELPPKITAVWLLLLTYTVVTVAYSQEAVRAISQDRRPYLALPVASGSAVFILEALLLSILGWLHLAVLTTLTPLLTVWLVMESSVRTNTGSKIKAIRRAGLLLTVSMLTFAVMISLLSKL